MDEESGTSGTQVSVEVVQKAYEKLGSVIHGFSIFFIGEALPIMVDGKSSVGMMSLNIDPIAIKLRDSILMRAGSVVFHCNLLSSIHRNCEREHQESKHFFNRTDGTSTHELLMKYSRQEMNIYEDIVFHLISLFDFIGNLVCFVFRGEEGKQAKWKGAIEFAGIKMPKEKKVEYREDYMKVINRMKKHHADFIKKLQDIRANSYHYQISVPSAKSSFNIMNPVASKIEINAPEYISKWMKRVFPDIKDSNIGLLESALLLSNESLSRASDIILALQSIVGIKNIRKYLGSDTAPDIVLRKTEET